MRISDWSSDVCSSDLVAAVLDAEVVPVDQAPEPKKTAYSRITAHREGTKQPVVVPWLRDPDERQPILRWALGYGYHILRFHLVRQIGRASCRARGCQYV